ncbi:MAG: glycosyltransferase [Vicinamibacterales bacterium]
MTVSVLVPAFNEGGGLAQTLAGIRDALPVFHARGWATELIVCDNNSTDDTAAVARAGGATVVVEPINQIARARNRAASAAAGDWLLFVDADSLPSPALFAETARAIEAGALAGGALVRMDDRAVAARAGVAIWNAISVTMRWAAGSYVFVDAAVFREIGGFDEAFYASEEVDLFRRLKRVARARRRPIAILRRHRIVTSSRKLRLYTWRETAGFLFRTLLSGGRTLTRRDACFVWYDGRR